jgi:hypothetical protein
MMPTAMEATVETAAVSSPGECRGRSKCGGAESGGRDESEDGFARHDDFSSVGGWAFCPSRPSVEERSAGVHWKRLCGRSIANNSCRGEAGVILRIQNGSSIQNPDRASEQKRRDTTRSMRAELRRR